MSRPVTHFEIVGRDKQMLKTYYQDLFDWTMDDENPRQYALIDLEKNPGGGSVGGGIGQSPAGYEGHVTFYVMVPDVEAALVEAERLGGKRIEGPEEFLPGVVLGWFRDPEGNVVGLEQGDV